MLSEYFANMGDIHSWDVLEQLFENYREGVIVVDRQGVIIYTNPYYERMLGVSKEFSREHFWGKPVYPMNETRDLVEVFKTGKPVHKRLRVIERAGIEVITSLQPVIINSSVEAVIITGNLAHVTDAVESLISVDQFVRKEHPRFQPKYTLPDPFQKILGNNVNFVKKLVKAAAAAKTDCNVLIEGESGTGKELMSLAIHESSARRSNPFVIVNCAAIPETLLESELFGYEAGAFTGASKMGKIGKFEAAHGGTLFLDEVGELPLTIQAKMLRAIQFKQIEKIGGSTTMEVDVRIIAATNKNLREQVKLGCFREDLYYRFSVLPIDMPSLRQRKREDLYLLAERFLDSFVGQYGCHAMNISPQTLLMLFQYDWPGNIRELKNAVEHAFVMAYAENSSLILPGHLPKNVNEAAEQESLPAGSDIDGDSRGKLKGILKGIEKAVISQCLADNKGDIDKTSRELGVSRSKLYANLKEIKLMS